MAILPQIYHFLDNKENAKDQMNSLQHGHCMCKCCLCSRQLHVTISIYQYMLHSQIGMS